MYSSTPQLAGATVREIDYPSDLAFPLDEVLASIGPSTRAVLIANPNNPTGPEPSASLPSGAFSMPRRMRPS